MGCLCGNIQLHLAEEGLIELEFTSFNPLTQQLVVALPDGIEAYAGSHLLIVRAGEGVNDIDAFNVTLGTVGLAGPQGPPGVDGSDGGTQGPPGADGSDGAQGPAGADGLGLPATTTQGAILRSDGAQWVEAPFFPVNVDTGNTGGGQPLNVRDPFLGINYVIATNGRWPSRNGVEPFFGEIMLFAGNFAPRGWALCNGQLLQVSSNEVLYTLLGAIYGGDGRTTFGLPDLRSRTPVHPGRGPGLDLISLGQMGGFYQTGIDASNLPSHHHAVTIPTPSD